MDLSRTVGWFTTRFPVHLLLPEAAGPAEALKSIKEQLRRVPNRGIGHGLLRYLRGDGNVTRKLEDLPRAEVCFNYLGQFDAVLPPSSPLAWAGESTGPLCTCARGGRRCVLEINAKVTGGELKLAWTYSENLHRSTTIEGLAGGFLRALRALMDHCRSAGAGGYTPSDFPQANLNQDELDSLMARFGGTPSCRRCVLMGKQNIEAIYPLTPSSKACFSTPFTTPRRGYSSFS